MTGNELTEHRKRLGMTQSEAAAFFQTHPRTYRRWEIGENVVPRAVVMVMRIATKHNWTADEVRKYAARVVAERADAEAAK